MVLHLHQTQLTFCKRACTSSHVLVPTKRAILQLWPLNISAALSKMLICIIQHAHQPHTVMQVQVQACIVLRNISPKQSKGTGVGVRNLLA